MQYILGTLTGFFLVVLSIRYPRSVLALFLAGVAAAVTESVALAALLICTALPFGYWMDDWTAYYTNIGLESHRPSDDEIAGDRRDAFYRDDDDENHFAV